MASKPLKPGFCTLATLANLFVLSERRIQQLASGGVIPRAQDGEYPIKGAVNAYVLFLREQAKSPKHPKALLMADEKLRLAKAQADRAEYENARLCRRTLDAKEVYQGLDAIAALLTACIDALPGRLAFELTHIDDPAVVKATLSAACQALRQSIGEQLHVFEDRLQTTELPGSEDPALSLDATGSVGG